MALGLASPPRSVIVPLIVFTLLGHIALTVTSNFETLLPDEDTDIMSMRQAMPVRHRISSH